MAKKHKFPLLPLRDIVVYPKMIVPLFVGRAKSITALQAAESEGNQIVLVTQKNPSIENPTDDDVYKVGTLGNILQLLKLPDGTMVSPSLEDLYPFLDKEEVDENMIG